MLEIRNISKSFSGNKVLDQISYSFDAKHIYGLIGANGTGKSTLLGIMAGVVKPDSGDVLINGVPLIRRADFAREVAYVAQGDHLISDASMLDNLRFFFDAYKADLRSFLNSDTLDTLGLRLSLKKRVDKLSGGMRKKVSILTALANDASVVLLDEPTSALDVPSKLELFNMLRAYSDAGKLVVMSSHDELELKNTSKRLMIKAAHLECVEAGLSLDEVKF